MAYELRVLPYQRYKYIQICFKVKYSCTDILLVIRKINIALAVLLKAVRKAWVLSLKILF